MYINGLNVGGATVMSGVGDMSDITQTLIGTTANTAWPGWADDFRVYVGTVSPEEMYAIFRVSHSAYNAVQQVGFSAFNVTFPAQPGGDTKMFLGFNATYNNTIYKLTPSSGTSSGSPAVLGEDVAVRGPLRGFGINMLGPPFSWPYGGYIAQNHAWVFTTGDLPSRIRVFRPDYTYDGNVNGQQFVCDFVLVLAPNGMIQGEATETFLARDQGVTVPQFERPDQPVHPVRPELGRSLLPQITSYVMAPRTTYAVATTNCNIAAFASYILPGDVGPILVTDRGFSAGFALMRNNYGEAWSNYGGLYLYFDLEVENPGFQGVDNAVDGSGLVPTGAYPTGWGVNDIAASFTVGPADIRLDRFTIRVQNLTLDWFSCTVELYSVSSGQPALPTGPPLAAGQLMASGHSATATSLSFMFPETVAEVLLRRGQRYSFKIGPCDHDGLSWAYVTTPGRRIRRGPVTSGDVSVDTGLSYDSSTGQWSTIPAGNELIWSMDISKEPVPPYDYATGSVVVAFPAGQCGATGTYGVKFTPSCDLPCPELPPFQVNAAIAEPDEWCRDNRTAAPFTVGPHTITVTEVPGPTIRYPGDWALWYLRIRTDGTQMKSVVLRNATLELPDRAVGSQWRSRVLWYPGAAMPLGNALKFPPGGSEILYQVPSTCAAGTANDTGADCVRVGVRLNMGNSPNSHALQEGVDSGLTRVRLVLSVDVKYWDETQPARKRDLGGGGTEALVVRAEMTVRMGTPVAGRRLKVHGE
ncbi:hypothetical protein DFJ74DRAFT_689287 [Hyaloraphidium curvatum]|nr:hypothetical protein DFJ74DRAFT_689287 [Hyaloraphidium curvatum]